MKFTETSECQNFLKEKYKSNIKEYYKEITRIDNECIRIKDCLEIIRRNDYIIHKMIAHELITNHRTNQQSIIKNLYQALKEYSKASSDLRNEESIKWAKHATDKEFYFPYI